MFSKDTKVKFFYSEFLSVVQNEVNAFIEALPEGYQISYMRYYPPKYEGAKYVFYIIYEPMVTISQVYYPTMMEKEDYMETMM